METILPGTDGSIFAKQLPSYEEIFFDRDFVTFAVIFNLGYVFHELIMGNFFKRYIGSIQRETCIIPLIALAFVFYIAFQAYFLPAYFEYDSKKYQWALFKTLIIFGAVTGFFWHGLQGGLSGCHFRNAVIVF